jgi:outer membrane lipoprotein-sorting protein
MSVTHWCLPAALAVLITGGGLLQAAETPEQIIADLTEKAEAVETVRAHLTMTMAMMGQKMTMTGPVLVAKPRRSRIETSMDLGRMKMEQIVISDGSTIWTYQPTLKMVHKIDAEKVAAATGMDDAAQTGGDIMQPLRGLEPKSIKLLRTEQIDEANAYVLEGSPRVANMPQLPFRPERIRIWIEADHGLLRKVVMFDAEGAEMMSQNYDNIEVNVDVPDEKFQFTPPEGVQVLDMTEGVINMLRGLKEQND